MIETGKTYLVMGLGVVVIFSIVFHDLMKRLKIPSLVGFILLGLGIKVVDSRLHFLNQTIEEIIQFLAEIGQLAVDRLPIGQRIGGRAVEQVD